MATPNLMTGRSSKKQVVSEVPDALYSAFTEAPLPTSWDKTPLLEWSDAAVNSETWSRRGAEVFVDPDSVLPSYLEDLTVTWKRPPELFPGTNLVLYDPKAVDWNLTIPSCRCQNFGVLTSVIETLGVLHCLAVKEGFPVEAPSSSFVPTTSEQPWRPWHHIYAKCKAGKGETHKPAYCSYGKYVVRLYYMGSWRAVQVDDLIPCDADAASILPVTQLRGELWPLVLLKAVLKVVARTGVVDLPLVSLFTGWINVSPPVLNKCVKETWRCLWAFLPHFQWSDPDKSSLQSGKEMAKTSAKTKARLKTTKTSSRSVADEVKRPCFVLGTITDTSGKSHCLGLTMCRDQVLKVQSKGWKPSDEWKMFRWVAWAEKQGIWKGEPLGSGSDPSVEFMSLSQDVRHVLSSFEIDGTPSSEPANTLLSKSPTTQPAFQQWTNFHKLAYHLVQYRLLLKPSSFPTVKTITYPRLGPARKEPNPPFYVSPVMSRAQNEPPYIIAESTQGSLLCFSIWVSPQPLNSRRSPFGEDMPAWFKTYRASLLVERYDWREQRFGKVEGGVRIIANGVVSLWLDPGRHVLRLWLDTESPFLIKLFTNMEVHIVKGPRLHMLKQESLRIANYTESVSSAFLSLVHEFGKPGWRSALKSFYRAAFPGNTVEIGYLARLDHFLDAFLMSLVRLVRQLVAPDDDVRVILCSLQSLFMNPGVCLPLPAVRVGKTNVSSSKTVFNFDKNEDNVKKIVIIQSAVRGYQVRMLLRLHDPHGKHFHLVLESLQKVGDCVCSPVHREANFGWMVRDLILQHPDLLNMFRFHKDLSNVIQCDELSGSVSAEPHGWVPLFRVLLNVHTVRPQSCAFFLYTNLEHFRLVVVNNDTMQEVFRLTKAVNPNSYQETRRGYTLLGYGWAPAEKQTIHWRLDTLNLKYCPAMHPCRTLDEEYVCSPYQVPKLRVHQLLNNYIPNARNVICRCIIRILSNVLVTIRMSVSYENAEICVKLKNGSKPSSIDSDTLKFSEENTRDNSVVAEAVSKGAVLLPAVFLEFEPLAGTSMGEWETEQDDYTYFTFEATVLSDTWPLTNEEWEEVQGLNGYADYSAEHLSTAAPGRSHSLKATPSQRKRSLKNKRQSKSSVAPYWRLQVVTDAMEPMATGREGIMVYEDTTRKDEVRRMKSFWEERHPGRRQQGHDVRHAFVIGIDVGQPERLTVESKELEVGKDVFPTDKRVSRSSVYSNASLSSNKLMPTDRLLESHGTGWGVLPQVLDFEGVLSCLENHDREACSYQEYLNEMNSMREEFDELSVRRRRILHSFLLRERESSLELLSAAYNLRAALIGDDAQKENLNSTKIKRKLTHKKRNRNN